MPVLQGVMYYTITEAASYTRKGIATIKRALAKGTLKGIEIDKRTRLFTREELDAYLGSGTKRKGEQ